MKAAIFNFSKPTPESTVASNRIATFLSEQAQCPIIYDASIAEVDCDVLFIVNGAFGFCKYLADLASAVIRVPNIIWVQNDYTIIPPKEYSDAESPFRKAFVTRRVRGMPNIHWWTTVEKNARRTPWSAYINWNSLTYDPIPEAETYMEDFLYYGAFREKRRKAFDFFLNDQYVTISSTSKKFSELYPAATHIDGIPRSQFYETLGRHAFGLYIEDNASHTEFHSPANRFYEMLSARLPMLFQAESVAMMKRAGFDVTPYIIHSRRNYPEWLDRREDVLRTQQAQWAAPYVAQLKKAVLVELKKLKERHNA